MEKTTDLTIGITISIVRDGAEIGEWSKGQVRDFFEKGQLMSSDFYWHEGMSQWEPLRNLFKPPPPSSLGPGEFQGGIQSPSPLLLNLAIEPSPPPPLVAAPGPTAVPVKPGGIGRLVYIGSILAWWVVASLLRFFLEEGTILFIGIILIIALTCIRAKNIGFSPLYGLIVLIPLANIIFLGACLFMPANSARNKKGASKGTVAHG